VNPGASRISRIPYRKSTLFKLILLFLLLIVSVIGMAVYSTFLEDRRADQQFSQEMQRKIEIASSVQNNQVDRLRIIAGIVKEQNQRYCDFLDYDNKPALTFMLKSIATIHDLSLAFVFDEHGDLITAYPRGSEVKASTLYRGLIGDGRERTHITAIPAVLVTDQIPGFPFRTKDRHALGIKAVIPLLHDTGEIYGFVVLVELINGNKNLVSRMADLSQAEIIYYDMEGRVLLTSFAGTGIPLPIEGRLEVDGQTYGVWGASVADGAGNAVGRLFVAANDRPFIEKRRLLIVRNLIPFLATVFIGMVLLFLLKTRVFDKIRQVILALRGISEREGDLSIRLPVSPRMSSGKDLDEVEQMIVDFNHMMDKLEEAYNQLAQARKDAERASVFKSQFLANMSHEIRTPMNAVIGFSDMLVDTGLDDTQADYVATIKRSGDALLSIINDILDFSKIEAGELQFEEVDFDPELIAYDVCNLIQPRIGSKPIEILCRIGNDLPSLVMGDPTRFRQVLTNLMGNAPKFTERGEIELSMFVEEETDSKVKIHTTIRDTGIGIPSDKLTSIFESFQQADGSTTRKYGGTGLGLSICRRLSELMNGHVWAESNPSGGAHVTPCEPTEERREDGPGEAGSRRRGPGSTFHFTAWFGKARAEEPEKLAPVSLSGRRVLIADDNPTNLEILGQILKSANMDVAALTNGEMVLPELESAVAEGREFHLCIVDIQMPVMSGYDIAREIRAWEGGRSSDQGAGKRLPLVALSSLMARDSIKCEEAGFDAFLSKPIRREHLYLILEGALGKRLAGKNRDGLKSAPIMTEHSLREKRKHSVRILLAEDNPVNQKLAHILLTKAGYQVEIANDGKEAVEKFVASPDRFDLIFMDVQMPEMDGLEATRCIRKRGFDVIPIVAMTAHAIKGDEEICLEAGMNDYITKPIKREIVFEVLDKWVLRGKPQQP